MSSHTYHPLVLENGLCDECPRCAEIAADPWIHMDNTNFKKYYDMTLDYMEDKGADGCKSDLDRKVLTDWESHIRKNNRLKERLLTIHG